MPRRTSKTRAGYARTGRSSRSKKAREKQLATVGTVKRIIRKRSELKYLERAAQTYEDLTSDPTLIAGGVAPPPDGTPFDVPQGTTDITRIGDNLQWCGKIDLKYTIWAATGPAAAMHQLVRIILFQWKDKSLASVGGGPSYPVNNQILLPDGSGNLGINSLYSHDNRQNYVILYDRTHVLINDSATAVAAAHNVVNGNAVGFRHTIHVSKRISLKRANKDVQYIAGGLQASNRIFMIRYSDVSVANYPLSINRPQISFATKIFFRDS